MSLDEEGFVAAEIRLGAFPGHQKVRSKSIKVCVAQGIACHPFNLFKMSLPFSFLIPFWYYLFQTIFNSVTWFLRPLCSTVVFFFPLLVIKAVSHSLSNNLFQNTQQSLDLLYVGEKSELIPKYPQVVLGLLVLEQEVELLTFWVLSERTKAPAAKVIFLERAPWAKCCGVVLLNSGLVLRLWRWIPKKMKKNSYWTKYKWCVLFNMNLF